MKSNRLEAFSDGVIAIIITIMVLELEAPEEITMDALTSLTPVLLSYVLSFIYVGIYWNNHHHLFQITEKVNGKILWANLHLLFWLSLIPFATSWLGENHIESLPVALYGATLLCCGMAYVILQTTIVNCRENQSDLKKILGARGKEKISIALYILGIILSFFMPWVSLICYFLVAFIWFIPDKKFESTF